MQSLESALRKSICVPSMFASPQFCPSAVICICCTLQAAL